MKKLYTLFALLSIALLVKAVPADPTPFVYTMPDGSEVMAVLHGDEYHSYITDLEGNLLEGTIPTKEEYQAIRRQSPIHRATQAGSGFPLKGSPRSIAILVNFKDTKFQYTQQDFYNLLNQSGYSVNGATGSCRDYFIACSDSIFSPQLDVFGPVELSKTRKEYLNQDPKYGTSALVEAVAKAAEDGLDFAQYDTDNDGVVDNIFFYYAGHNQAEGGGETTIWPHQGSLIYKNLRYNGKLIASYACTSELRGASGNTMCPIGTFCHEFGHVLGLPDFYDTNEGSNHYTVDAWDIMAGGNYNNNGRTPPSYSGYERFYLGWRTPVQLKNPGEYTINPLTEKGEIYLIAKGDHNLDSRNPNPTEFFLMELRESTGWDAPSGALVNTGILIWHIDFNAAAWSANNLNNDDPLRYHLEEAGGNRGRSYYTDPYPGPSNVTSFTPTLHSKEVLATQPIYDISVSNGIGHFTYISKGEQHLHAYPSVLDIETTIGSNGKPEQWEAAQIRLVGEQLGAQESFTMTLPSKNSFTMTLDPEVAKTRTNTKWRRSITLTDAVDSEGKLDTILYINFNAQKLNCDVESAGLTIVSDSNRVNVTINGSAPRHTYVKTPTLKATSDITPNSFMVNWKAVTDAEAYYLTIFQSEKGESEMTQDFESFDKASGISAQGWQTNFVATTTGWKKDGMRALLFKNNHEQVVSEEYQAALSEVSFYLNAFTADVDTIGELDIEGQIADGSWISIDTLYIPAKTKAKKMSVAIEPEKNIKRIRLTYWDMGGNGVAMDQLTATLSEKISYLYRGRELSIDGGETSHRVTGLTPSSTYYYQIQCTDLDKGCEEHLTPLSDKKKVETIAGEPADSKYMSLVQDSISYDTPTGKLYVDGIEDKMIYIYEPSGRLVWSCSVPAGTTSVVLPPHYFVKGRAYIATYAPLDKLGRKNKMAKFVF